MKYYRRNPGDYLSATGHLTLVEHGAYNVLMDTYYATENALPAEHKALYRIAGAHDARERAAVDRVVTEFFKLDGAELVQDRIEIEIASGREKSQKLSENGSKGADARTRNREAKEQAIAQANAQAIAKQKPRHIHQPSTITEAKASEKPGAAPPLPDWLDVAAWESWRQERRARKKAMTPRAEREAIENLTKLRAQGQDPAAVIKQSIANGWTGLFEISPSGGPKPNGKRDERQRVMDEIYGRNSNDDNVIDGTAERVD